MSGLLPVKPGEVEAPEQSLAPSALPQQAVAVPALESLTDWEAHRQGVLRSLAPANYLERVLAERIALLLWRLARVAQYEAGEIQNRQEAVEKDLAQARKHDRSRPDAPVHPEDVRGDVVCHEENLRLLQRFARMKEHARLSGDDADTVLNSVARAADVDLRELPMPYVGIDDCIEEIPGWTAGRVRECIGAIATVNPDDPAELLQIATDHEQRQLRLARYEATQMEQEIRRMRQSRLLTSSDLLNKVSRYEIHLSHELQQALAELRGLQLRRQEDTPATVGVRIGGLLAELG